MSVKEEILSFTRGESRENIYIIPNIPQKKLDNAITSYITHDEDIIVLVDDTVFGSAKDGLSISENYVCAKEYAESPKILNFASIQTLKSKSGSLNNFEIHVNGALFVTLTQVNQEDRDFLMGILMAAKDAANPAAEKAKTAVQPSTSSEKESKTRDGKEASDITRCSQCDTTLPADAKFCLECGAKVLPKGICLECNAKLPEKAKFCPECGTPAGEQKGASVASPVTPAALDVDEVKALAGRVISEIDDAANEEVSSWDFGEGIHLAVEVSSYDTEDEVDELLYQCDWEDDKEAFDAIKKGYNGEVSATLFVFTFFTDDQEEFFQQIMVTGADGSCLTSWNLNKSQVDFWKPILERIAGGEKIKYQESDVTFDLMD